MWTDEAVEKWITAETPAFTQVAAFCSHTRNGAAMVGCKLAAMDELVTLRPVIEDDLSWLAGLTNDPAVSGPHEWHGWSDPQRRRRRWAESGLLGDDGGTLIVLHGADRVGHVSWRKV